MHGPTSGDDMKEKLPTCVSLMREKSSLKSNSPAARPPAHILFKFYSIKKREKKKEREGGREAGREAGRETNERILT